jgi:DNA-directed RNA polymerase specialized sigma24 family protein
MNVANWLYRQASKKWLDIFQLQKRQKEQKDGKSQ